YFFFFQAEDGIRDRNVTGVQTCALPISCQSALHHLLKHCAGVPKFITASKPSSRPKAWAPDSVTKVASHPSLIRTARLLRSSSKPRSEEHTSELQSRFDLVCRLLLEKKTKHSL